MEYLILMYLNLNIFIGVFEKNIWIIVINVKCFNVYNDNMWFNYFGDKNVNYKIYIVLNIVWWVLFGLKFYDILLVKKCY